MNLPIALVAAVVGYLLGSLSFARIVASVVLPREDISTTEFEIPGTDDKMIMKAVSATSISVRSGPSYGCLTTLLDMLKVTIPTFAFWIRNPDEPYFLVTATMGVVGHNWPLYYSFKGGRGFSPVFGGMLVVDWIAIFVTSLGGMVLGLAICRDVLIAYMAGMWLLIPWLWFRTHSWAYLLYAIVVNILFIVAMIPELRQYIRLKREGKVHFSSGLEDTHMRHISKLAQRLGLSKNRSDV